MSVSNYTFKGPAETHSSTFFEDLGNYSAMVRKQSEITNYYKQYAWIQSGDSFITTVGKIALGIITLTSSLWITWILDWATEGRRQEAFDLEVDKDRDAYLNQIQKDIFRQDIHLNDENLYELGWKALEEKDVPAEHLEKFRELHGSDVTFGSILESVRQSEESDKKEGEDLAPFSSSLSEAIKTCVRKKVLPGLFNELKEKYGLLRALQILDGFSQTISHKMEDTFAKKYIVNRLMEGDEGAFSKECSISGGGQVLGRSTPQVTQLDLRGNAFKLKRGLFFVTPGKMRMRILAEIGVDLQIDLTTFTGRSITTITPDEKELTRDEVEKLNQVWKDFSFQMAVPNPSVEGSFVLI